MIHILDYQERWPREFATIASTLRHAFGDTAVRINHIGSTAVPGLASKDVIDVQITVADLESDRIAAALTAAGYRLILRIAADHRPPGAVGPDSDWAKWFANEAPNQRRANIHIRAAGRPNQRYALLFRDYLRAHPESAAAYAELKRRLAPALEHANEQYPDIKDPVCDLIMIAAEVWAATTAWQVGPSDA